MQLSSWNHCTPFGSCNALSLWSFASFAAKVSHPPKLRHSQKRKQPNSPESGAARCRTSGKSADFRTVIWRAAMVSDTTDFARCQTPLTNLGLVSDTRFATMVRTEMATGVAEGTRKAQKSRGGRGGERKTPIFGMATLTLRPFQKWSNQSSRISQTTS